MGASLSQVTLYNWGVYVPSMFHLCSINVPSMFCFMGQDLVTKPCDDLATHLATETPRRGDVGSKSLTMSGDNGISPCDGDLATPYHVPNGSVAFQGYVS